ncbi:MFS general substrate transporter [Lentinus brumalis]|uniref:MFS general substrate transporter n=1 Tax=Lentinus brumalis TaxID=2498619 RepID=A0A371CUM0_9APHY|nr:MFS general substrate transporter [Polyporus brumalis]
MTEEGVSRQLSRDSKLSATYPPAQQTEQKDGSPKAEVSRPPWGLVWRSSIWFITLAVGLGVTTDILVYSMIVPIVPFRLQNLGYEGVSGLVGWLLFAYSAALVVSTPPIAYLSEKYKNRKVPLLCGQFALIGSQVLLMEAPTFAVMVVARIFQGISASVIWVVGLALVCDTVPETIIGKQLGFVMMGMTLGFLVGPPVAGALDDRFGFRGPFIFGVIVTALEFIGRLLIIERKDAIRWDASLTGLVGNSSRERAYGATAMDAEKRDEEPCNGATTRPTDEENGTAGEPARPPAANEAQQQPLSIVGLLVTLLKSPRAMGPVFLTFIFGLIVTSQEPALPLYLQSTYGLDVSKVGLVYLAAVIPSFFSAPLSGWYADRGGTVASTLVCAICTVPFYILIFIKGPLVYFLVMFAFLNFFSSALISPVTAELAAVTRSLDGVGYGHSYGAFNVAYGIGSAVGPVIGGQLYDHVGRGWMAISLFDLGMILVGIVIVVCFFGERPVLKRAVSYWLRGRGFVNEHDQNQTHDVAA